MAAVAVAMAATRGTLAIPGALRSQPARDEDKKPNPGNPGGPNDPDPPDDPWDAYVFCRSRVAAGYDRKYQE